MLDPDQYHISKLYFDVTYAGLILGTPDPEMNRDIIDSSMKLADKLHLNQNVKFINPIITNSEPNMPWYQRLPNYRIMGELSSRHGIQKYGDYRYLQFVGFIDDVTDLKTSINNLLKDIDWEQNSTYFDLDNI